MKHKNFQNLLTEPIEITIEELSSMDIKIILAIYNYEKLRFSELLKITRARSKPNLSKRLKILIKKELIKKIDKFYCLTESGKKIAKEILDEQKINELEYFKRKLIIFTHLINCFSFPLKIKAKYNIEKILNHYIALLYIKSLHGKIFESSKKSIKSIKNIWKIIEKPEDNQLNISFNWKKSIKEVLEELEKDIKEKEEEKELLILFKKQLENENINLKLFNELHEFSKNPTLWYLKKTSKIEKMIMIIIIGMIGIIPSLIIFLMNKFLLLPLLFEMAYLLIDALPYDIKNVTIVLLSLAQYLINLPQYLILYISIGAIFGMIYAFLYEGIPSENSKIKGIILALFFYSSFIIIVPYSSFLLNILIIKIPYEINLIQGLISFIVSTLYVLLCSFIHGYTLGFLWDRIIKLAQYIAKKRKEKREEIKYRLRKSYPETPIKAPLTKEEKKMLFFIVLKAIFYVAIIIVVSYIVSSLIIHFIFK